MTPVELLHRLVEIDSPSYAEGQAAGFLVAAMRELGFDAHVDAAGNAVGVLDRGPGPHVLLLGHIDTVPGPVPVRVSAGRLYGRGSVDAKGPLTALVCGAAQATALAGRVTVVGAVEEETPGSRGAVAIRERLSPPDALIVGEPSGWSSVVLGYKGKLDLRITAHCPAAHPTSPTPRASELVARAWVELLDLVARDPGDPTADTWWRGTELAHRDFDRPAPTLVGLHGDAVHAQAEVSVRTPPGFDADEVGRALRARVPDVSVAVLNWVPACRATRTNPVVRALNAAIADRGARPAAKLRTATSDMNTLAQAWDIPMATYGPGDSTLDHTDDEHIVIEEFLHGVAVVRAALERLAAAAADPGAAGASR